MMPIPPKRPIAEANRLSTLLNMSIGSERFPVDVEQLAKDYGQQFGHDDAITNVIGHDLPGFEGALYRTERDGRSEWALLYNSAITVPGRIRFTIAHELGHYILHRKVRDKFQCSEEDMLQWESDDRRIEAEADTFASYLLMPLDDFRRQLRDDVVDIDRLASCATRYGVSLTAAILKWLEFTAQRAIFVMSRDGYILWARSSESAYRSGAFFRTRDVPVPIPTASLAASDTAEGIERSGVELDARIWLPREPKEMCLREMRITSDRYEQTMSLLILPPAVPHWGQADEHQQDAEALDERIRSGHFSKR